jgi:hypothetical protein
VNFSLQERVKLERSIKAIMTPRCACDRGKTIKVIVSN